MRTALATGYSNPHRLVVRTRQRPSEHGSGRSPHVHARSHSNALDRRVDRLGWQRDAIGCRHRVRPESQLSNYTRLSTVGSHEDHDPYIATETAYCGRFRGCTPISGGGSIELGCLSASLTRDRRARVAEGAGDRRCPPSRAHVPPELSRSTSTADRPKHPRFRWSPRSPGGTPLPPEEYVRRLWTVDGRVDRVFVST